MDQHPGVSGSTPGICHNQPGHLAHSGQACKRGLITIKNAHPAPQTHGPLPGRPTRVAKMPRNAKPKPAPNRPQTGKKPKNQPPETTPIPRNTPPAPSLLPYNPHDPWFILSFFALGSKLSALRPPLSATPALFAFFCLADLRPPPSDLGPPAALLSAPSSPLPFPLHSVYSVYSVVYFFGISTTDHTDHTEK